MLKVVTKWKTDGNLAVIYELMEPNTNNVVILYYSYSRDPHFKKNQAVRYSDELTGYYKIFKLQEDDLSYFWNYIPSDAYVCIMW